jgi:hypothetical protein
MNKFLAVILAVGFSASALAQAVAEKPVAPVPADSTTTPATPLTKKQAHKAHKQARKTKKVAKKAARKQAKTEVRTTTPSAVK